MGETPQLCRNCQAAVTGEYCSQCGQREGRADQRFLDLAGELTGDLFDWDSRVWRTLFPLLFRPGFLSAEFIAGRRARYLPPLRLYIIVSFVLFLVISQTAGDSVSIGSDGAQDLGESSVVLAVDPNGALAENNVDVEDPNDWDGNIDLAGEDSPPWLRDLDQRLEGNVPKLKDDPGKFIEALVDYMPQMMFLLLPLFALLIRLVYLFSPFHYLQHLVFSLHYHSFVYLLYLLSMLIEYAGFHADGWLLLGLVVYMPLALHKTYGSGFASAIGRSLFVYVSYAVMLAVGFAAVGVLALALL